MPSQSPCENACFPVKLCCSGFLLNGTVRPELAPVFLLAPGQKGQPDLDDSSSLRKIKASPRLPGNFGTGRDEAATLRVSQAQTCLGQMSKPEFPDAEANGQGKCRAVRATAFPCTNKRLKVLQSYDLAV